MSKKSKILSFDRGKRLRVKNSVAKSDLSICHSFDLINLNSHSASTTSFLSASFDRNRSMSFKINLFLQQIKEKKIVERARSAKIQINTEKNRVLRIFNF